MTTFQTSADVANRGLQFCGASRIASLDDDSKNASAVSFVYDKLRQAELRRSVWKFSVRKAVLRAIDENTQDVTFPAYSGATGYTIGDVVSYLGALWLAPAAMTGVTPGTGAWLVYAGSTTASLHDATVDYNVGELVYVGSVTYMSLASVNDVTPPGTDWHVVQGATLTPITILEPAEGYGRFLFKLPAGFLRYAPDPKRGAFGVLGGPAGNGYTDMNFEGPYVTSSDPYPILLRFAADIVDVTKMDPLFCEGLASRIGIAVCEELTQSSSKLGTIASQYKTFMGEARIVNAIEVGPAEPAEDDYITVRR